MRNFIAFCSMLGVSLLSGADLDRHASFPTSTDFVTALTAFTPATSQSELTKIFSLPEPGEIAEGAVRPTRIAPSIQECSQLWADDNMALIFATARPPTDATPTEIGALFLIARQNNVWRILDVQRFTALGKYAKVTAELTAAAGSGYSLSADGFHPIITIMEFQGGRGYSYDLTASFTIHEQKIKQHALHQ